MNENLRDLKHALSVVADNPRSREPLKFLVTQKLYDICLEQSGQSGVKDFVLSSSMQRTDIAQVVTDCR